MKDLLKLLLVRHGETEWNKTLRYQGHTDIPLSAIGREQAMALSQRLVGEKIDAFYASDLIRARETAEIIARNHNQEVSCLQGLRETYFGDWEGLTYVQIIKKYPQVMSAWRKNPSVTRIPGGETLEEVAERSMKAIASIQQNHADQTVLLVVHGGIIRVIISSLLGVSLDDYWKFKQDNTALNIIEIHEENKAIVCLLNDINHLPTNLNPNRGV